MDQISDKAQMAAAEGRTPQQMVADRKKLEYIYPTTEESRRLAHGKHGLLGILKVIRMADADLNTLALGMDLTTLGLNLTSPDVLYHSFNSPFTDTQVSREPDYRLPACYQAETLQSKPGSWKSLTLEALFYAFYNMPGDLLQARAAQELYARDWRYIEGSTLWIGFKKDKDDRPVNTYWDTTRWAEAQYGGEVDPRTFTPKEKVQLPPELIASMDGNERR